MTAQTVGKLSTIILFTLFATTKVYGQFVQNRMLYKTENNDTLQDFLKPQKKSFFQQDAVRIGFAPALFFGASAATWGERKKIREIRDRYIPTFKHGFDDYIQYAPAAGVYGMKFAGVKGRNNLFRATLSHGTSLAIMAILVNGIKYTAKVQRPDASSRNSFPSGHTAMAFTNATFMHKEYGSVRPIYSVAGYSVATFTALGRGLNNRHWISDVMAGAGIGILSAQLGYFFIDKIYKNKGDNMSLLSMMDSGNNLSFLSVKLGNATATRNIMRDMEDGSKSRLGFEAGFEGAYFFTENWGMGGELSFTSFPLSPSDAQESEVEEFNNSKIYTQSIGSLNIGVGPYYAIELSKRWQLMFKAHAGVAFGSKGTMRFKLDNPNLAMGDEIEFATYKPQTALRVVSGASITYKFNQGLGMSFYADYNYSKPTIKMRVIEGIDDIESGTMQEESFKQSLDYVALGLRLSAFF